MDINPQIVHKLYRVIALLGGQPDILAVVGSIGDTLTDEEALSELNDWIKKRESDLVELLDLNIS